MKTYNIIQFFLFYIGINITCISQNYALEISSKDSLENSVLKKILFQKIKLTDKQIEKEINSISKKLIQLGFLNFKIVSRQKNINKIFINYKLNTQIKIIKINIDKTEFLDKYLKSLNYKYKNNQIHVSFLLLDSFIDDLKKHYENNGYSFIKLKLTNHIFKNNILITDLEIRKNKIRRVDKIIIKGYEKFPAKYLKQITKLNYPFNKNNLEEISNKLSEISFVSIIKKSEVLFLKDSTLIYVYLKKKKINQFDGLIGLTSNAKSKTSLNGYLNLDLNNLFDKGEEVKIKWKSTNELNKQFDLTVNVPYIFNTNINPKLNFKIYSQDSSYINISSKSILFYPLNYKNKIGLGIQTEKSTSLLKNHQNKIQNFNTFLYGIDYNFKIINKTTSFYRNKAYLNISLLHGESKLNNTSVTKSKITINGNYLFTLNSRNEIFIKNSNYFLLSKSYTFNELEKIGGNNTLRGFKENSIPASTYNIINLEYNYLSNKNTYIYSITDFGYVVNKTTKNENVIFSFGVGYKTKIKNSNLNVNYTIGKINNQIINFKNSKLNIGFKTFF